MFVVQPEISEEGSAAILGKLDSELERHGSMRLLCEDWGKRKLAYEIDKFQKGHYRILRYLDDGKVVRDLERQLRLEESVLRFLTVLVDEDVRDLDARRARAAEEEEEQVRRAAERAEREAEEARQREEHERYQAEQAAAAEQADDDSDDSDSGGDSDDSDDSDDSGDAKENA
jgi:small subunit ribosomal protein S6